MIAQIQNPDNSKNLNVVSHAIKVDQDEARRMLTALGYGEDDPIYVRAFFHSSDPRHAEDKGRKADRLDFNLIEQWQRERRGVYFVVNGGGQRNEDVKQGRAIFYEHDNLDKEVQLYLWESLGLPEPTFQVDTGGKSIHSYWVFDQPIPIENWKVLQTDLLEFSDGDRSIKNESRVMRLAGGWHISDKGVFPTTIISSSGKRYTFEQLRGVIPTKVVESKEKPKPKSPQPKTYYRQPLTDLDWAILYIHALNPCRVDDYNDYVAVGMALHSTGDPGALPMWINWSRQSSKFKEGECEKKWESFKSNGVGIGTLAHMAKLDGWVNPFKIAPPESHKIRSKVSGGGSGGGDDGGNIIRLPVPEINLDAIKEIIKTFLESNPTESQIETKKVQIRIENTRLLEREIARLFETEEKELEKVDSRPDLEKEVGDLIKISDRSLELSDYIPHELAEPIKQWCQWLNIKPEVALTTVLATISSLHKVGTKLTISHRRDFTVSPNMFAAIIAESGQKKSPIFRTFAKKPLRQLKKEAQELYEKQYKEYEALHEKWVLDKNEAQQDGRQYDEPEPKPPNKPAPFYFNHATGEGITTAAAANPDKTLFALIDELAGYFNAQDSYRNGKGSDKQDVLSYHDGEGKTVLRAAGVKVDVDEIYLSIFGTIQPAVIKKLMGNSRDDDGQWARFFFVNQPLAPSYMDETDSGSIQLHERITGVYREAFNLPCTQYMLSPEAFKVFVPWYNQLEQMRVQHPNAGMRALYSKAEGHTGVLALNLHLLNELGNRRVPSWQIPAEIMKRAIALMKFYIGQTRLIYADLENELAPELVRIINMSKTNLRNGGDGYVKVKTVQESFSSKQKHKAAEVKEWFSTLVELGHGVTRQVGRSIEFKFGSETESGQSGQKVGDLPTTENLTVHRESIVSGQSGQSTKLFEPPPEPVESNKISENLPTMPTMPTEGCDVEPETVLDNNSGGQVAHCLPTEQKDQAEPHFTVGETQVRHDESTDAPEPHFTVGELIEVVRHECPYKGVVIKIAEVKISSTGIMYIGNLQRAWRREDRKRKMWMLSHDEVRLVEQ